MQAAKARRLQADGQGQAQAAARYPALTKAWPCLLTMQRSSCTHELLAAPFLTMNLAWRPMPKSTKEWS